MSVEVMQAINIGHELKPVPLYLGPLPLLQHLREMLDIFDSLKYWSRLWIVQEIVLAKDILVSWGTSSCLGTRSQMSVSVVPAGFRLSLGHLNTPSK